MSMPMTSGLGPPVVPLPVFVPPPPPPRDWGEFSSQVSASPLGKMAGLIGGGFAKGWEFLKANAPDVSGALVSAGGVLMSGATKLMPAMSSAVASIGDAAGSVTKFMPSLTGVVTSIHDAAEAVSSAVKPVSGVAGSISGVIATIGVVIDKAKWFLVALVALVVVLLLAKVVRLCLAVAEGIGKVVKFMTK
jgi:hypothetical protein